MSEFVRSEWLEVILKELIEAGVSEEVLGKVKICLAYAETAIALDSYLPCGVIGDVKVNRCNLTIAKRNPKKTTLVVAGVHKRDPVVTFHTGNHGISVFHEFLQREVAGSVVWKPDTPVHAVDPGNDFQPLPSLPGR